MKAKGKGLGYGLQFSVSLPGEPAELLESGPLAAASPGSGTGPRGCGGSARGSDQSSLLVTPSDL